MSDKSQFKILIVDDDDILRQAMVFDFQRKGFQVLSAANGEEAFESLKKEKVDLVLSDMRMPGGDGMTLLEKIRKTHPSIPVLIFITGFADVTEDECIAKGAKCVLSKPYNRRELMNLVCDTLGIPREPQKTA